VKKRGRLALEIDHDPSLNVAVMHARDVIGRFHVTPSSGEWAPSARDADQCEVRDRVRLVPGAVEMRSHVRSIARGGTRVTVCDTAAKKTASLARNYDDGKHRYDA
jgi:hypothetical protein